MTAVLLRKPKSTTRALIAILWLDQIALGAVFFLTHFIKVSLRLEVVSKLRRTHHP